MSYACLPGFGRFASNGLVLVKDREAFLFDTPVTDSLTSRLVKWLSDSLKVTITGFVPNHWHNDCMGGLKYLQGIGVRSYANQKTIDIAAAQGLPVPGTGFRDSLVLDFYGSTIECFFPGLAHSLDNIVVWIPSEKMLFAGCMVKSLDSQNLGNTVDGDIKSYSVTIEKVIKRYPTVRIVIPGHGSFGGPELLEHTLKLSRQ